MIEGGWSDLGGQARKFHYFPSEEGGTRALCGKWAIWAKHSLQPEDGVVSKDDCVACRRRLDAQTGANDAARARSGR